MPKFLNANNSISSSEFSSTYSNDIIIISKDTIFQVHDKTFKEILKNSIKMTKFLKSFIGLEVNSENLKICNSNFITNDYKRRESDILYKNINKNIFYLVEHQSTINVDMPRRILEYSTEIMREIKKNKLELSNPLIVPIVIYTGNKNWNVPTNFSNTQTFDSNNQKFTIKQFYKLIDINKFYVVFMNCVSKYGFKKLSTTHLCTILSIYLDACTFLSFGIVIINVLYPPC